MAKLFDIQDTTVAISDLTLTTTRGEVTHNGNISVVGDVQANNNLTVKGTLTVNTINVANLITQNGSAAELGQWIGNTESDINGKGFSWTWGTGQSQLIYRGGGRLWTSSNFDLGSGSSYKINNVPVLTTGALGPSITSSALTEIGTLEHLQVSGDANIGQFAFFNSTHNRLGIGTEEPSAALDILDNNVEITLGSPRVNVAQIGTASNHDLLLATDGQPRVTIKNSGEIIVPGNITVNGTLTVDNLVTDSRVDRTHPIQFLPTQTSSIYNLGLIWAGTDYTRQLILLSGPDRLYSSEHVELAKGKQYHVNNQPVLSEDTLGSSVVNSSLNTVGTLSNLNVAGLISSAQVSTPVLDVGPINVKDSVLTFNANVTLAIGDNRVFYSNSTETIIGNVDEQSKPVKLFGPLSVNINNPDPSLSFSVAGDVSIGNKRFTNGTTAPHTGSYQLGDICWNSNPIPGSYSGWVCVVEGTPGQWLSFGNIATQ
jgi:hypothetical protein